ncbi:hypothetical protein [Flavobacterium sp. U410]
MKKLLVIITLLVTVTNWSQERYKYVIVPAKFEFLKEADKYGLNTLTKSFFETEGFTVFYDTEELPLDIANNRCSVLYANVIDQSKLFTTNIAFEIKDCLGKILLVSEIGSSREKSYEVAYKETFREALSSMKGQLNFKNNYIKSTNKEVIVSSVSNEDKIKTETPKVTSVNQLFALPIENGYKLVDSVPTIIYTIQESSVDTVYFAQKGDINGIFHKKINGWFFDSYQNGKLISEKVDVKF